MFKLDGRKAQRGCLGWWDYVFDVRFRNRPMAQKQLFVLRPDFEPSRHAGEPFVTMRSPQRPIDAALIVDAELGLDQIKVDAQLPVDLGCQAMLDHLIHKPRERDQDQRRRRRIPQCQTKANRTS